MDKVIDVSSWAQITKPLRRMKKKIAQESVNELIHRTRDKQETE